MSNSTLYDILGVASTATAKEIKSAYRKLASEKHPDKNNGEGTEEWTEIQTAYDTLKDQSRRDRYDQTGETGNVISLRSEAIQFLQHALRQTLTSKQFMNIDYIEELKLGLVESRDNAVKNKQGITSQMEKIEAIAKNHEGDFIESMLNEQIAGLKDQAKQHDHAFEVMDEAKDILATCKFLGVKSLPVDEDAALREKFRMGRGAIWADYVTPFG